MTSVTESRTVRTPIHLWVIGILALLWNMVAVVDYVMMRMRNADYLRSVMPKLDPQIALGYMDSMPLIATIAWAIGVWGAIAGTLLLLAHSRHAVTAYLASLVGAIVTFAVQFTGPTPPKGMDDPVVPVVVVLIATALVIYARMMRARGVLR